MEYGVCELYSHFNGHFSQFITKFIDVLRFKRQHWNQLNLKIGTGVVNQLPQTVWDKMYTLLKEVNWNIGDILLNPLFQSIHYSKFGIVYPLQVITKFSLLCNC